MKRIVTTIFAATILFFLVSCNGSDPAQDTLSHADDDSHTHNTDLSIQSTEWGDTYEIFMEYELPAKGEPVEFVTHVTSIETGKPRTAGPVSFLFTHENGEQQAVDASEPARDGIYLPLHTFSQSGIWNLQIRIRNNNDLTVIPMGTIFVYADVHERDHAEAPVNPEGISFLKEQAWKLSMIIRPVEVRPMTERVSVPAKVIAKPGNKALVLPPVAGILRKAKGSNFPAIGQPVKAGDVLAAVEVGLGGSDMISVETLRSQIVTDSAKSEAVLVEMQAALSREKQNYERVKSLFNLEAKSKKELEQAEFSYETAISNLDAAKKVNKTLVDGESRLDEAINKGTQHNALPVAITSPIDGIITEINGSQGSSVLADDSLFTIINPDQVYVEARIQVGKLADVNDALLATYSLADGSIHEISDKGRLVFKGLELDQESNTIPVIYEIDNSDGSLLIGSVLTLQIETDSKMEAVAIPQTAIVDEDGQDVVYVQLAGEAFERRVLTTGFIDSGFVQVLEGLKAGEWIVTQGAYAVRLAAVSTNEVGHGHTH